MLLSLVPLVCALSTVASINGGYNQDTYPSAASTSQTKFAIENKYDDTGPASQRPVYAYNTYKTLEEALVAYFDDPDTQLPPSERAKAVQKLLSRYTFPRTSIAPLTLKIPSGYKHSFKEENEPYFKQSAERPHLTSLEALRHLQVRPYEGQQLASHHEDNSVLTPGATEDFQFQKVPSIKDSSLTLAHYTRDREQHGAHPPEYSEFPTYSFAYGVHDPITGDIKRAGEKKTGNTVQGFYRFIGPDGKARLVQYRADDKHGFRAQVDNLPIGN